MEIFALLHVDKGSPARYSNQDLPEAYIMTLTSMIESCKSCCGMCGMKIKNCHALVLCNFQSYAVSEKDLSILIRER